MYKLLGSLSSPLDQRTFPASLETEVDMLHYLEFCPMIKSVFDSSGISETGLTNSMICLWIKIGRPHPVIIRQNIHSGKQEPEDELVELLGWSWNLWIASNKMEWVKWWPFKEDCLS